MWLLENKILQKLEKAYASEFKLTEAQFDTFKKECAASSEILDIVGETAVITIDGVLTAKPDFFALFFGGGNTTYEEIIEAVSTAESSRKIESIQLNIDSPGGEVLGLFEVLDVIKNVSKPVVAMVGGMAASAAYAIAAQAYEIVASNRASMVGSVGVAASIRIDKEVVDITSTNAPDKRPDVQTEEGRDVVVAELDAIEKLFIDEIAVGRNTTANDVKKNFGRGAVVLAEEAKNRGMIDKVAGAQVPEIKKTTGANKMANEVELDLKAAIERGVAQERDRVLAHLTMGEASGDMQTAIEAIRNGDSMTMDLQAKYLAAGMRKTEQEKRVEDNPAEIAVAAADEKSTAERVVEALEMRLK